ncbi:hypothetical protein GCM10009792_20680 [Microcella alkalica]|uniref:Uncharacterized protein n=1 Tax=Microcella alkalica TaxID=355930 RepID=A0A839EAF9_9MICO|nr:hypothetical protein [Microcella alkalica]MBA8847422.1 hypothetical protein [Microcella alkalica]
MSVFAVSSAEAIDLDLSGLTSVLAVVLGIGVIVLLVWMWRIGHQLETAISPDAAARATTERDETLAADSVGR